MEIVKEVACEADLSEFEAYVVPPKAREGLLKVEEDSVEFGIGSKDFFNMVVELCEGLEGITSFPKTVKGIGCS